MQVYRHRKVTTPTDVYYEIEGYEQAYGNVNVTYQIHESIDEVRITRANAYGFERKKVNEIDVAILNFLFKEYNFTHPHDNRPKVVTGHRASVKVNGRTIKYKDDFDCDFESADLEKDKRVGFTVDFSSPECDHEWVETPGFMSTYKDCKKCGKKWEDV